MAAPETPVPDPGTAANYQVAIASKDKVSKSIPHCDGVGISVALVITSSYNRTCPTSVPPPSFRCALLPTRVPVLDRAMEKPLSSPALSPSISGTT